MFVGSSGVSGLNTSKSPKADGVIPKISKKNMMVDGVIKKAMV
jgi:hypothetical protein